MAAREGIEFITYVKFDNSAKARKVYACSFFNYSEKMFCYLWFHEKHQQSKIALMKGNKLSDQNLISEGRVNIAIMIFNTNEDLPIKKITTIIKKAIKVCYF